ncbi:CDC48 family AAA ATPase [Candidatus Woesearchaeota archaeon]|nr:CDC48 family AAA ATPase [Candidatus Woesearchaeota archaeon]
MKPEDLKLKVAEAMQDDVNKGIVRIDSSFMRQIDIRPGSFVEIEGERKTIGIADRSLPGDIGLNIIRTDPLIRRNARTSIGELVSIRKADVREAKKVIIAPARKDISIRANPVVFRQGLLGRAVLKGDLVSLGGSKRRRIAMSNNPMFDDLFAGLLDEQTMFGGGFILGDVKFVVADTNPKQAVFITENTEIIFNPEAIEVKEERGTIEVSYEDIGGLGDELTKVREMVELPLKHPEIFQRLGIDPPKGVLLYGPPGTGKTLLAKAVANEAQSNFILINGPEIMSKYYGQSEENLRKKFEEAEKNAPSIIFIDEIDAIASKREESKGEVERRVVAQLLAIMDGLNTRGKVVVIAATNIQNSLDPALRRPGRFDREIEIGVPSKEGRENIIKIHTRNMPLNGQIYKDILAQELLNYIEQNLLVEGKNLQDIEEELVAKKSEVESESLMESIKNRLKNTRNKIKKLENLQKIYKTKKNLDIIVNKMQEVYNAIESREINDPRSIFTRMLEEKFSEEIKLSIKDLKDLGVLETESPIIEKAKEKGVERDVRRLSEITHGFVGADLAALAKEAAMIVLRRILPDLKKHEGEEIPQEVLEKLIIHQKDFMDALKVVRPSALREVLIDIPDVKWTDIGGLEDVKQELIEAVEWPLKRMEAFKRLGVTPPKGVLLYGPPGTGKTLLAKAVASESEANFIVVKGPELLSKWVGESEKAVRKIFEKARQSSPSIIFFDEIDALAPRRGRGGDAGNQVTERVVNQFLTEIDGLQALNDIVVVAATNRPDIVDTALLRPGRFDRIIHVGVPDDPARKAIFQVHLKAIPMENDVDVDTLVAKSKNYVGADIEAICREAAIYALREDAKIKKVGMKHFEQALKKVKPSITEEIEKAYEEIEEHFRSARGEEMKEERPSYYG